MGKFLEILTSYCNRYHVSVLDRALLLCQYPLFKLFWCADYAAGPVGVMSRQLRKLIPPISCSYLLTGSDGLRVRVPLRFAGSDLASFQEIFWGGTYDCADDASPIRTLVDLGGNTGMATLFLFLQLKYLKRAIVVEPNPQLIQTVQRTLAGLSGLRDISVEQACVSGCPDAMLDFVVPKNHRHAGLAGVGGEAGATIRVRNLRLSDLLDNHNLKEVDLLKMDIEGAEHGLLQDMNGLRRCRLIIAEVHGEQVHRAEFAHVLSAGGFQIESRIGERVGCCEVLRARRK